MTASDPAGKKVLPPGGWLKVPQMSQEAWATLYGSLRQAIEIQKAGGEFDNAPTGAMAAEAGLQAVVDFLQACPELMQAGAVGPLTVLSAALRDLQKGKRPSFLLPRNVTGGRPGTGEARAAVIGFAARAMKELMDAGETAPEAAKAVHKAIKVGKAAGWKKTSPATIKNWRARCEEGPGPDISSRAIEHYKAPLPQDMGDTPTVRAKNLIKVLSESSARGLGE